MMMIDADALMELYADRLIVVAERYSPDSSECGILSGVMKLLEIQPTIEERKTGKWLRAYGDHEAFGVRPFYRYCFACNESTVFPYNYCPSCGAMMEGEQP